LLALRFKQQFPQQSVRCAGTCSQGTFMDSELPLVSVLFVTYRRIDLLKSAVDTFLRNTKYPNLQIVIADDGSGTEIQDAVSKLPADDFILSPKNRGLGANNNSGLSLCRGKYILMLQDDWLCVGPPDYLLQSVSVMELNPQVGLINYAGGPVKPDMSLRLAGSEEPCYINRQVVEEGQDSYLYSDQPHLQSRASLDYVGPYVEARHMEQCERDYEIRWRSQKKFAAAIFPGYFMRIFRNQGVEHSLRRSRLRYRIDDNLQPIARALRQRSELVYKSGRFVVRAFQHTLEWIGIAK